MLKLCFVGLYMFNFVAKFALNKLLGRLKNTNEIVKLVLDFVTYALIIIIFCLDVARFCIDMKILHS